MQKCKWTTWLSECTKPIISSSADFQHTQEFRVQSRLTWPKRSGAQHQAVKSALWQAPYLQQSHNPDFHLPTSSEDSSTGVAFARSTAFSDMFIGLEGLWFPIEVYEMVTNQNYWEVFFSFGEVIVTFYVFFGTRWSACFFVRNSGTNDFFGKKIFLPETHCTQYIRVVFF